MRMHVMTGVVEGAVWGMFSSISLLSFDVPLLLSSAAMLQVALDVA